MLYEKISEDLQNEVIILTEKGDIYALNQEKCDDFEKKLIEREAEFDRSFSFDGGRLKKMILLLTEKCNLRCRYCYMDYGNLDNKENPGNIDIKKVKSTIDSIFSKYKNGVGYIQFFGGEPLLAFSEICGIIEHISMKCTETDCELPKYGIVTNGMLLDKEKMEYFSQNRVQVMVSIDGNRALHDAVRLGINKIATFDKISEKVKELTKSYNLFFELTLNREHILAYSEESVREWFESLKSMGFRVGNVGIIEMSKDVSLDLCPEDYEIFQKIERDMIDYFFKEMETEKPLYNIDIFRVLMRLLRKDTKSYSCGAGVSQITMTTEGVILPCPKFAEHGFDLEIGTDKWQNEKIQNVIMNEFKKDCDNCWARQLCIGYCYALKYRDEEKKRILDGRCWHVREMNKNVVRNIVRLKRNNKISILKDNIKEFEKLIE